MASPVLIFLAFIGLALAALLVLANRFQWRFANALGRGTYIMASLVGVGLIAATVLAYCCEGATMADSLRNGLMNIEIALRNWFHSLSLR